MRLRPTNNNNNKDTVNDQRRADEPSNTLVNPLQNRKQISVATKTTRKRRVNNTNVNNDVGGGGGEREGDNDCNGGVGGEGNNGCNGVGKKPSSHETEMMEKEVTTTRRRSTLCSRNTDLLCLCQKPTTYYTRWTIETKYCCAIDGIDGQRVGCCNLINNNAGGGGDILPLFRPNEKIGYMVLCDEHRKRFQVHNSCAGCGVFCTQVVIHF